MRGGRGAASRGARRGLHQQQQRDQYVAAALKRRSSIKNKLGQIDHNWDLNRQKGQWSSNFGIDGKLDILAGGQRKSSRVVYRNGQFTHQRAQRMPLEAREIVKNSPYRSAADEDKRDPAHFLADSEVARDVLMRLTQEKLFAPPQLTVLSSFARYFGHSSAYACGVTRGRADRGGARGGAVDVSGWPQGAPAGDSVRSFTDLCSRLGLPELLQLAADGEGWQAPTPVQGVCWASRLTGEDALLLAPHHAGKTTALVVAAAAAAATAEPPAAGDAYSEDAPVSPAALVLCQTKESTEETAGLLRRLAHPCGVCCAAFTEPSRRQIAAARAAAAGRPLVACAMPAAAGALSAAGSMHLDRVRLLCIDDAEAALASPERVAELCTILLRASLPSAAAAAAQPPPPRSRSRPRPLRKKRRRAAAPAAEGALPAEAAQCADAAAAEPPAGASEAAPAPQPAAAAPEAASAAEPAEPDAAPEQERRRVAVLAAAALWDETLADKAATLLRPSAIVIRAGDELADEGRRHFVYAIPEEDFGPFVALLFSRGVLPLGGTHLRRRRYAVLCRGPGEARAVHETLCKVLALGASALLTHRCPEHSRVTELERFADGGAQVLVATDAACAGLDAATDLCAVVNFGVPLARVGVEAAAGVIGQRAARLSPTGVLHTLLGESDAAAAAAVCAAAAAGGSEPPAEAADIIRRRSGLPTAQSPVLRAADSSPSGGCEAAL
eukprot:TRINITY_DN32252_c0_g1_i1.p1 TRINITY_DN32252_c0_g1~~TRINITY_DN32252_c0_g1_i1.p1  ORF type:complete len:757 (+),score=206.81 TRINITY_DN32252_c0_g1_i1:95-2272(+)